MVAPVEKFPNGLKITRPTFSNSVVLLGSAGNEGIKFYIDRRPLQFPGRCGERADWALYFRPWERLVLSNAKNVQSVGP